VVIVVGGGVIGVCAAYYLARRGLPVTLVERAEIAAGSSYGNAGLIVPSHSVPLAAPGALSQGLRWLFDPESPFYIRPRPSRDLVRWLVKFARASTDAHVRRSLPVLRDLSRASLALYRELAALPALEFGFCEDGALAVYRTSAGLEHGHREAAVLEAAGITARVLDGAGARALEPALRTDVVGAVHFPGDAHVTPDRFVRGLARAAEGLGARLLTGTEVLDFGRRGRRITAVETTRGDFAADQVVLAAGSWSASLARGLGLDLPLQPAKGYSVTCDRPAAGPRRPLLLAEARVAVTPMGDALRFAGTLELAGLDLAIDRRRVAAIRRAVPRYLAADAAALPVREIWRGLRPCSPDGLPYIGRPAHCENLIVATGHAMIGVSLGPVSGALVAQLAADEPPAIDVAPLSPDRFA
jgi:D-amino-acid dehydrogenase